MTNPDTPAPEGRDPELERLAREAAAKLPRRSAIHRSGDTDENPVPPPYEAPTEAPRANEPAAAAPTEDPAEPETGPAAPGEPAAAPAPARQSIFNRVSPAAEATRAATEPAPEAPESPAGPSGGTDAPAAPGEAAPGEAAPGSSVTAPETGDTADEATAFFDVSQDWADDVPPDTLTPEIRDESGAAPMEAAPDQADDEDMTENNPQNPSGIPTRRFLRERAAAAPTAPPAPDAAPQASTQQASAPLPPAGAAPAAGPIFRPVNAAEAPVASAPEAAPQAPAAAQMPAAPAAPPVVPPVSGRPSVAEAQPVQQAPQAAAQAQVAPQRPVVEDQEATMVSAPTTVPPAPTEQAPVQPQSEALPAAPRTGQPVVALRDVTKVYGEGDTQVVALDHINVDFIEGEFTSIMGPSGSGKSTMMHVLAGLDNATSGNIYIEGNDITLMDDDALTKLRRERIGFVFQSFNLVPTLDAKSNILLPMRLSGHHVDEAWLDQVVNVLGLQDRLKHRPSEMSGGQQQRVAVARALVMKPAVIVADEPTGNLDSHSSDEVLTLLRNAVDQLGQTVIMVTHDPQSAMRGDRVLVVRDGQIVHDYDHPELEQIAQVH